MTAPEGPSIPTVYVGDRVVVRYLLGDGAPADWRPTPNPAVAGPSQSDVTGIVLDIGDPAAGTPILLERDGSPITIARAAITSVRVLSRVTVRNSEIRALEFAAAKAWPGIESTWIDGWLVRAGGGFTRRANSAIPLEIGARADTTTMQAISHWYAERDLPPILAWPDRLLPAAAAPGDASAPVQVLTAPLGQISAGQAPAPHSPAPVDLQPSLPPGWIDHYHYASGPPGNPEVAGQVVSAVDDGEVMFASIRRPEGDIVAIGRGAVTADTRGARYLGITALHTVAEHRGAGYAGAIMAALLEWGSTHAAATAYVQVEHDNRLAGQWYRRLGFGLMHEYRYIDAS